MFLACGFWLAEAYATLGRQAEAEALFTATLHALPSGVGVMAEMLDPATGNYLGNVPQGLSHLALIHAACSIGGDAGTPLLGLTATPSGRHPRCGGSAP